MTAQKLELTWIGKNHKIRLEPRILIEDTEKSYGDPDTGNMLIHGDNLLALKALEQDYAGKVKCIYIDPPYNTGNAFEHYDDGLEHSEWLNLMKPRLEILRRLLTDDGLIWVTLDDNEAHYCKVMLDEIFGRQNFLADVIWEKADSPRMDAKYFSTRHDHILTYSRNINSCKLNRIIEEEATPKHYNKKDKDGRIYYLKPLRAMGADGYREKRPSMYYSVITPDGTELFPKNPDGTDSRWRWGKEKIITDADKLEWIKTKNGWSLYFRIYLDDSLGAPPETIWSNESVGSNRTSKKEIKDLFQSDIFDTPKPERLIKRIIEISTEQGDLVLDSFLGSGTTCAVAHKMGRKYIGIELGDHAYTHSKVRMDKVIDGTDQGGVSESMNWKGGGGYKFYELGPSVMAKDERGRYVINPNMNGELLVRALCKIENFRYLPKGDGDIIKHGYSTERDFLHVTTRLIDQEAIDRIKSKYLKDDESILILAKTVADGLQLPPNIQVKKIPNEILRKCEYAKDDYSLPILTQTQEELEGLKKDIIQIDNQD